MNLATISNKKQKGSAVLASRCRRFAKTTNVKTIFMNHPLLLKCPGGARVAVDDDAVDDGARVVRPWWRRGPWRAVAHSLEVADALIQRCPRSMRATITERRSAHGTTTSHPTSLYASLVPMKMYRWKITSHMVQWCAATAFLLH